MGRQGKGKVEGKKGWVREGEDRKRNKGKDGKVNGKRGW